VPRPDEYDNRDGSERGSVSAAATGFAIYLVQAIADVVLGLLLVRLRRSFPRPYLADWSRSWLALAAYHALAGTSWMLSARPGDSASLRVVVSSFSLVAAYLQIAWLARGTRAIVTGRRWPARRFYVALAVVSAIVLAIVWATSGATPGVRLLLRVGLRSIAIAIVLVVSAIVVYRSAPDRTALGPRLLGASFLAYGATQAAYFVVFLFNAVGARVSVDYALSGLVDLLVQMSAGLGMTVWLLEDEHRLAVGTRFDLESSRRLVDRITEASPHTSYIFDVASFRVVFVSPQVERDLGIDVRKIEAAGPDAIRQLLHPDDLARVGDLLGRWRDARDGEILESELRVRDARGGWRWYLRRDIVFERDEEGRVRQILGTAQDISERKRVADEIAEREARLALLLEQMPVVVWTADSGLRFTSSTGSALGVLGLAPGQVVGMSVEEYLGQGPGSRELLEAHRRALGGETRAFEVRWSDRDFAVRVAPQFDLAGEQVGVIGVALDVTERRELEARLRETQKLESLGVLAGGIAHDFNNLLTGIAGHAELAARAIPADSPAQRHLSMSIEGTHRAADLARQMLAYAGRGSLEMSAVDLGDVTRDLVGLLGGSALRACRVELEIAPDLPAVEADVTQIRQVVLNLLTNSGEALGAEGGQVRVSVASRRLERADLDDFALGEALEPRRFVVLRIEDDGPGMDADTRERIFEPFFSTKPAGRGLGLAVVLGIVRSHRGALRVDSEPGRGSAFEVAFPTA